MNQTEAVLFLANTHLSLGYPRIQSRKFKIVTGRHLFAKSTKLHSNLTQITLAVTARPELDVIAKCCFFFLLADISDIPPRAYVSKGLYLYLLAAKCADTGQCRSRVSCWKFVLVPKQCPRLRPIIWYLFCCARCLGSQDIVQNHTHIHTYIHTHIHDPAPSFIGHRLFDSGFAPAALSLRLNNTQ